MIAFKNALQDNKKLVNVNMANNGVREQAIGILQPVLASGHIQSFNVDVTLPLPMFEEVTCQKWLSERSDLLSLTVVADV